MKKLSALLLSFVMVVTMATGTFASQGRATRPTSYDEIIFEQQGTRGERPPASSQVFDLDSDDYNGLIQSVGTRIFTNTTFITTEDEINAYVYGTAINDYLDSTITTRYIELILYKSNGTKIDSVKVYASEGTYQSSISADFDISDESASTKYYVCFGKTDDSFSLKDLDLTVSV